jgi:autotransporter translocation and assembly factor TamB
MRVSVLLGLLCAACSTSPFEQQQDSLAAAQRRWRAAAIPDYSFTFQRGCFCAPIATRAVTVTVQQGAWASLRYVDDGTVADTSLFRDYLTMERVFAFLHRALDEHPARFDASYAVQLGFPAEVYIDYNAGIADDEGSFRISDLQILTLW